MEPSIAQVNSGRETSANVILGRLRALTELTNRLTVDTRDKLHPICVKTYPKEEEAKEKVEPSMPELFQEMNNEIEKIADLLIGIESIIKRVDI